MVQVVGAKESSYYFNFISQLASTIWPLKWEGSNKHYGEVLFNQYLVRTH